MGAFYEAVGHRDLALRYRHSWDERAASKRGGLILLAAGGAAAVTFGLLYLVANTIDHTPPLFSGFCLNEDGNCPQWQYGGPSSTTTFFEVLAFGGLGTSAVGALIALAALSADSQPVDEAHPSEVGAGRGHGFSKVECFVHVHVAIETC
jgi:hypothetical protein